MGDVECFDASVDVFGLGAILCEILTGKPPYLAGDAAQVLRMARRAELEPAFERLAACGCDDELLVLTKRCLAPEPRDRPENAGVLATELTAYLESVEARLRLAQLARIEAQAKTAEERKRRTSQLSLAATILVLLFAGILGIGWALKQEKLARRAAEIAENKEREQRELAERRRSEAELAQARAVSAEADTKAFSDFLVNRVLAAARPQDVQGGLGIDVSVADALLHAQELMDEDFAKRPIVEATARHALGVTWRNLAQLDDAERNLRRAVELRTKELGPQNHLTLQSQMNLGQALLDKTKNAAALQMFNNVRDVRSAKLGVDHPDTLQSLNNIALTYRRMGRRDEAIALFEKVRDGQIKSPSLGPYHPDTLATTYNLAESYRLARRLPEAIQLFIQARDGASRHLAPDHPELLRILNGLGTCYFETGPIADAIALFEQVREVRERKLGAQHPQTLTATHNLASAYEKAGRTDEALKLFELVCDAREKSLGMRDPLRLRTMQGLGESYLKANKAEKAIVQFQKVLRNQREIEGDGKIASAPVLRSLGVAFLAAGKFAEAAKAISDTIALDRRQIPVDQAQLADDLAVFGRTQLRAGKPAEAETALREAITLNDQKRPNKWQGFSARCSCGESLLEQKRFVEAEALLVKGYEGLKRCSDLIPIDRRRSELENAIDLLIRFSSAVGKPGEQSRWQKEKSLLGPPAK